MAEELEITPFTSAQDQISDSYVRNRSVRNRYETTPTFIEEEEKEVLREETAPIKEQEANALANNQKSLLSEVGEFVTNIGIGAVKAVEETAQVFGARDNILK